MVHTKNIGIIILILLEIERKKERKEIERKKEKGPRLFLKHMYWMKVAVSTL